MSTWDSTDPRAGGTDNNARKRALEDAGGQAAFAQEAMARDLADLKASMTVDASTADANATTVADMRADDNADPPANPNTPAATPAP